MLHDPNIQPRSELSKDQYMNKDEQTTVNHFHEKLLKLKDLMKTKVFKFYIVFKFTRPVAYNWSQVIIYKFFFLINFRQGNQELRKGTNSWRSF